MNSRLSTISGGIASKSAIDALGQLPGEGNGAVWSSSVRPGLRLLAIDREGAGRDRLMMALRQPRLRRDGKTSAAQALHGRVQAGIAEAAVVRAARGQGDGRVLAFLEMEGQLPGKAAEQLRLQP